MLFLVYHYIAVAVEESSRRFPSSAALGLLFLSADQKLRSGFTCLGDRAMIIFAVAKPEYEVSF
jgi:hypothetical protein